MAEDVSREEIVQIFEGCWNELLKQYSEKRAWTAWCSEGDVQSYLAHELLNRLPYGYVHTELPIPLEIGHFWPQMYIFGKVIMRKCIRPDIVIVNPTTLLPQSIVELKYSPFGWGFTPFVNAFARRSTSEDIKELARLIQRSIRHLETKSFPSKAEVDGYYLKGISKLIKIIYDFEHKKGITIPTFLCVIDEFYPDIERSLEREIAKHKPPNYFNLKTVHFPIKDLLKDLLSDLQRMK